MFKKMAIALLLISTLVLNSCKLGGGKVSFGSNVFGSDDSIIDNRFKQVVQVINNHDKNALKAMFSKQALAGDDNFDANMDKLFSLFQGKVESWERTGGPEVTDGKNDDGTGRIWKEQAATYDAKIGGANCHLSIKECDKDTKNKDNIGLISICIINAEDWKEEFNYWGDVDTSGIHID